VAILQIVRIENVLFVAALAWIGVLAGESAAPAGSVAAVTLTVAAILAVGNIFNDLVDERLDTIGKPWRPLPSGRLKRSQALALLVLFLVVALGGIVAIPGMPGRGLAVIMLALAFLYSYALKGVPLLGNLSVAVEVALVLLLAAIVGGGVDSSTAWVGLVIASSYLIYEFAKTARDRWHDRLFLSTAPARWTPATVWRVFTGLIVIDGVVLMLAGAFGGVEPRLLLALALPVVPFALHAAGRAACLDLNPVGSTVRASKLLFVPALVAMALWL